MRGLVPHRSGPRAHNQPLRKQSQNAGCVAYRDILGEGEPPVRARYCAPGRAGMCASCALVSLAVWFAPLRCSWCSF